MNNQAKPQGNSLNNLKENKPKLVSSAMQNMVFIDPGANRELRFFKLGRTEEEILIDIMGNISFPTKFLNAIPSSFNKKSK